MRQFYSPILRLIQRLQETTYHVRGGSVRIRDDAVITAFKAKPDNPYLVSFPRTGSHWLRMLMELYFERPSLFRTFYYHDQTDYLTLHTHDTDLSLTRSHVLYLYRNPVDVVYSQLNYHQEPLDGQIRIQYWASLYGRHLDKWLHQEQFTIQKTVLTYEEMCDHLPTAFARITEHFGQPFDKERLDRVTEQTTKEELNRKTPHDKQVVQLQETYEQQRYQFRASQSSLIWETLLSGREHLRADFADIAIP